MKKIIRIDSENRIAIVEPGVTFGELIPMLKKNHLRLNMPLLPRSSKSVIGSLLEREPVMMPRYHWDLIDPLACTEVIYGSGDLFRTGSAAGPGTLEEQWEVGAAQNEASGPVQADFARLIQGAQGTMGIVTWASIRCEQLPVLEEPFLIGSSNLDNLLDLIRLLVNARLVDDCLILNNTNLAYIIGQEGSQDYESIKASLPNWILFYTISGTKYFPEEKVKYQIQDSSEHAKSFNLEPGRQIGEASAFDLLRILHKPPNGSYWKLQSKGSCYDIFFLTTCDRLSNLNDIMKKLAIKSDYPFGDIGIYIQPLVQGVCYHCEYNLFFDSNNPKESKVVRELSTSTFDPLANGGAFFSRPYGPWADFAYIRDAQSTLAMRKVKGIFDPKNILNPGKLCFK
jgi:FAD/FMN-containing dehydrogenase